ncbi:glutathione peroxidase [Clostridium acidisoli DSM 12555]|uniref:Glutathione peroxidase n=1 Tax=Clostridium acidisoli DSM 12555 TaxID=1121291 RepID=A0A1W1XWE1_9CLOT|nr:glutathione peroxidase [Clostridium acidisoli]SMC28253.1 glutathione peroxidase [Clostridium acidisoli DSM 12555]
MNIYDFNVKAITGEDVSLEKYKGNVLIIANTASRCGFTPQYGDLEVLYKKYKDHGLNILGFPSNQFAEQEPGNNSEVKHFCEINYGVTFDLFEKIEVRGNNAHPLFKYLSKTVPFKGLDVSSASGRILEAMLKENYPEILVGNGIKWNFTKFLINSAGEVVGRFEPTTEPMDMEAEIKKFL